MISLEYPKTENLFNRDPDTHKLIESELRVPAFDQIKYWHVTEKIDGTNMRVIYCPDVHKVEIRGRSDRANIPGDLLKYMQDIFTVENLSAQFDEFMQKEGQEGSCVTIYGEGYGPGIQKSGGNYAPSKRFRMFDIMYCWRGPAYGEGLNSWAAQETVEMLADGLGALQAPVIFDSADLWELVDFVKHLNHSHTAFEDYPEQYANSQAEGIIARSDPYLFTHRGSRVMFKLKVDDLA